MELTAMKNIGDEMKKKLNSINVINAEDLIELGSKEAFLRLKIKYPKICLVHLYTLQGAVDNISFNMLSQEVKEELKDFSAGLK
jgi:TfoX C-terminal domain.